MLENARSRTFDTLDVTFTDIVFLKDIGPGNRFSASREIEISKTLDVLVEDGGVRGDRRLGRVDGRQCLVIDLDQIERIFRNRGRFGNDHCHRFADITHPVPRNHGPVIEIESP